MAVRPRRVPASPRERLDAWLGSAEAQLEAARRADPVALDAATTLRQKLQSELVNDTQRASFSAEDRAHGAAVARRIREIDLRVQACGDAALSGLEGLLPDAPPGTYGRRGQMRGI